MKATLTFFFSLFTFYFSISQSNIQQPTSINVLGDAPAASAMLDVQATDKGMLVPRMTTGQRTAIASPANGLLVFDVTTGGFWFYNGTAWVNLSAPKVLADADGDTKIQVEESLDEDIIRFDLGGTENMVLRKNPAGAPRLEMSGTGNNTFIGQSAGQSVSSGTDNTANGASAMRSTTTGSHNVAQGADALYSNTTGYSNVAIGKDALYRNTVRSNLVAVGDSALYNNGFGVLLTGDPSEKSLGGGIPFWNTALGSKALFSNTSGAANTATGYRALYSNGGGDGNTANGAYALTSNASSDNTAFGAYALYSNTTGSGNTANGNAALYSNTTGSGNTAIGAGALDVNINGYYNTAIGTEAFGKNQSGSDNVAIGSSAISNNTSGTGNVSIGRSTLTNSISGSYNIALGFEAGYFRGGSNNVIIGKEAGYNGNGSNNVFLGTSAGFSETGSDKLYIDNSNTTTPLLWGDFSYNYLAVNGRLGVGTQAPNTTLSISPSATEAKITLWDGGSTTNHFGFGISSGQLNYHTELTASSHVFYAGGKNGNGTELMRIKGDGNVGIGESSPNAPLHVKADGGFFPDNNGIYCYNPTNSANQHAIVAARVAGSSGGDPYVSFDVNGEGGWSAGIDNSDANKFKISNAWDDLALATKFTIQTDGNVGIGQTNPTAAKLVVNGSANNTLSYGYLNSSGTTGTASGTVGYSIFASARIAATEFNAFSDARIKRIRGRSNPEQDLATLMQLNITDYTLIDTIAKGNQPHKKVIAQEVKEVYPQAVSTLTDVIPDVYRLSEMKAGFVFLENHTLQAGERVKLILEEKEELVEVLKADAKGFQTSLETTGKVFVFGREVKDFHTVDYEALSALNISATQALVKKIEGLDASVRMLQGENEALKSQLEKISAALLEVGIVLEK